MDIISQQLAIMPYAERIRKAIKEMEKNSEETDFIILISPTICQGGFKLYGFDVFSHPALEKDKIVIVCKSALNHLWLNDYVIQSKLDKILCDYLENQGK